tara:strand:+ start:548 stop:1357 length:810 start_codon:yes stop_codon:yes gene_type:complete
MGLTKVELKGLDDGTDGQIITYDANGNPVAVGPGTDGQVLTSTGAGSPPAFEDAAGVADNSITLAKMAGLARGKLIYGDSSGDPAALTVGSANQVLTSDGTDVAWAAAAAGGLTEVDQWCVSSDYAVGSSGWHTLTANWQRPTGTTAADGSDLGTGMTQSSGAFTFPSTGFWLVTFHATGYNSSNRQEWKIDIRTVAGVSLAQSQTGIVDGGSSDWYESQSCSCIMDITDTSADAGKVNFRVNADGTMNIDAAGSQQRTGATFIKLADT